MAGTLIAMKALILALLTPFSAPIETRPDFSGVALSLSDGVVVETVATEPAMAEADWRWASISKLVLAVAMLQAVDDGLIGLDDPVSLHLNGVDRPGLTVRDLLRHTSGLPNPTALARGELTPGYDPKSYCFTAPIAVPGGDFSYNNCDFVVAAKLLEVVRGTPYARILQSGVFDPAGMAHTRIGVGADNGDYDGLLVGGAPAPDIDLALWGAAGDLVGPPRDLARFAAALMDGTLLSGDQLALLQRGEPRLGYVSLGSWGFSAPLDGCDGAPALVERRGNIIGVQARLLLAPDMARAVIIFSDRQATRFGEVWTGRGLTYELASSAFCGDEAAEPRALSDTPASEAGN